MAAESSSSRDASELDDDDEVGRPAAPVLPWDKFSNWVYCVCIVTFDLELGQALEASLIIYPGHIRLTEQEKSNICYLAFPDSNSGCMGDTQFHMRIRQSPGRQGLLPEHRIYNQKCPVFLQADPGYYYGYVYFRQVKDKSLPRGYFQKSVVLLSRLPFVNLFTEVCALVAPEYFENGEPSIETACHDIDQWPPPIPGESAYIPSQSNKVGVSPGSPSKAGCTSLSSQLPAPTVLSSVHEVNMFRCFSPIISHVHLLWELVLTAEPIVVMASSPTICSEMVHSLVSMIAPLMYCADYRPFFTIHDSEFKEYTTKSHAPPPVILGVTNPFFAKTLQHWPHIIRIGDTPNLGTQTKRPCEVQNAILRRHLLELTQSFMIPLERYMASLMPLQKNISPYKAAPTPRPFNPDDFLATLGVSGPQLTSGIKGDWVGLYRRFFRSSNFSGWFNARYREVSQKLQALQLEALSDADLKVWVKGKEEVEVVDMILRIRHKLEQSQSEDLPLSCSTKEQLQQRVDDIICMLPDDLRTVLKTS
ncbi:hypothetical protein B566_EDAN011529 [Ephemera danica]|nr:hypothetical protein B566_EDAN011529 [Ephemera danica]